MATRGSGPINVGGARPAVPKKGARGEAPKKRLRKSWRPAVQGRQTPGARTGTHGHAPGTHPAFPKTKKGPGGEAPKKTSPTWPAANKNVAHPASTPQPPAHARGVIGAIRAMFGVGACPRRFRLKEFA